MLDEISPVQFIEGVNECAEAADTYINTMNYSGVAIEYIPKVSYSLKKLSIFLTHQEPLDGGKYKVALCSDYKDNPSNIPLSKGAWVSSGKLGEWQEVELEKPAVVVHNNKYWLTIDLDRGNIGLPMATEGDESALRFRGEKIWRTDDRFKTDKVMLRFYGRVLPILT